MALVQRRPDPLPPDRSRRQTITFPSPADGSTRRMDVYSPAESADDPLPVVVAPHPITWTAAQDYHGGLPGLQRGYHWGWWGLADRYRVIIAMPHGHHRRVELCSLASPEQIEDLAGVVSVLRAHGYAPDERKVYACGLSMGGQEALVAAGRYPEAFTAVVAFNPIVDLAAWQQDLARSPVPEIREYGTARKIVEEVGGLPEEVPHAYAERSVTPLVEGLSRVPALLFWSDLDLIVPRQATHHAYAVYQAAKKRSVTVPIAEYEHTASHGYSLTEASMTVRWQLHEWCDYELALQWLLRHQKGTDRTWQAIMPSTP